MELNSLCRYGENFPLLVSSTESEGLGLCNPSILQYKGEMLINVRNVKYVLYHSIGAKYWKDEGGKFQSRWGPLSYLHPEDDRTLKTENFLGYFGKGFKKIDTSELDQEPIWTFIGLEDGRLIEWGDTLYLTGVRRDTTENGVGRMELSTLEDIDSLPRETKRVRIKHPTDEDNAYCEKNWAPIVDMPYHFVMNANPTQIVKVNPDNGDCSLVINKEKVNIEHANTRGSSQVINYKGGYLAITHDTNWWYHDRGNANKDAIYDHRLVFWDKDWNIQKISKKFKFMGGQIEFCCGMEYIGGVFYITFGFEDNSAHLLQIEDIYIDKLLEDAEYSRA